MSTAATPVDEIVKLYTAALRDVGAIARTQAVELRRRGIQAAARGSDIDAAYVFGAAAALESVAEVFEKR